MPYNETALYCDSVAYAAVTQWAATHAYAVGNLARQLAAPAAGNERCFVCVAAGTSLAAEPAWTLTRGAATQESGGPKWQECTGSAALNGDQTNTNTWNAAKGQSIANLGTIITDVARTILLISQTTGTAGSGAEPAWNTAPGATTVDGAVTWLCLGPIGSFTKTWASPHARLQHPLNGLLTVTWLANAGMTIFVGDDHSETIGVATTYSQGFSCNLICVNHAVPLPPGPNDTKTTAAITSSGAFQITFPGGGSGSAAMYVYGLQINQPFAVNTVLGNATGAKLRFEQCAFAFGGSTNFIGEAGASGSVIEFKSCSFQIAAAANWSIRGAQIRMEGCIFVGTLSQSGGELFIGSAQCGTLLIEGSDFSGLAAGAALFGAQGANVPSGYQCIKDCTLPAGALLVRAFPPTWDSWTLDLLRCDSGGTAYRNERYNLAGLETTSVAVVRAGGAADGATPISHQIATQAGTNNLARVFNAMSLATWNATTGTNRNATVYGIVNDTRVPNNDEFWFDVEYLGSAASPKGSYARGGKANPLAAGAALSVDGTSAWDSAATARVNSHAYAVGDIIKTASNPGRIFFCTIAGAAAGSEPAGYASAIDGGVVVDGAATFRAGCRFSQTLSLSAPQPAQPGYLFAYPHAGRPSTQYFIDPEIFLS